MTDVLVKPAFQSTFPDTGDPTTFGPTAWNAARLFSAGADGQSVIRDAAAATGASWGERSRVLTVSTTQAGTPGSLVETDLWTYALPANTLNANGRGLRITAWGTYASNSNSKTVRVYFGATPLSVGGAPNGFAWVAKGVVVRTGASAQVYLLDFTSPASTTPQHGTPAADTTGIITIKVAGTNGIASANDIVFRGAVVELLN